MTTDDRERGVYLRYEVQRLQDDERKHVGCDYFVLDLTHDKFARKALKAYAKACSKEHPQLAQDLRYKLYLYAKESE